VGYTDAMNPVLLTGAGFTKTFGGYLASEMWAAILNQPEIQNSPELLTGMRNIENLDYEMFYEHIQANGTEQEKQDLNAAIRSAFKEMDDNVRTRKTPSPYSCCNFISRIVQNRRPSYIFTLNQDLFFERYHNRDKITAIPGVTEHMSGVREADQDSSRFRLRLPTAAQLESRKRELACTEIAYVKLHGSQGWSSHDGSDIMVMGTGKASIIEKEPLLDWYFSLFEDVINRPDTRLLIVGYGFRDKHINERIVNAMANGLKLHVISPQTPQEFKNQFIMHEGFNFQVPQGSELWDCLAQYWPPKLTDFYYEHANPPTDLNPRGRALFRSLGLMK
jgi:hypothetical protein